MLKKGVRTRLPERPEGCFAQTGPDPFFEQGTLVELAKLALSHQNN
jgi:hypothetical protein